MVVGREGTRATRNVVAIVALSALASLCTSRPASAEPQRPSFLGEQPGALRTDSLLGVHDGAVPPAHRPWILAELSGGASVVW